MYKDRTPTPEEATAELAARIKRVRAASRAVRSTDGRDPELLAILHDRLVTMTELAWKIEGEIDVPGWNEHVRDDLHALPPLVMAAELALTAPMAKVCEGLEERWCWVVSATDDVVRRLTPWSEHHPRGIPALV